jgi:hypothetical protein
MPRGDMCGDLLVRRDTLLDKKKGGGGGGVVSLFLTTGGLLNIRATSSTTLPIWRGGV